MSDTDNTGQAAPRPATREGENASGNLDRAPSPPRPSGESGFDLNHPTIVSLLYLASYVTGVTGIVGIVLAHVWQGEAAGQGREWERSHYTYLIRTFWFGLLGFVIGFVLTIVVIGILILPAVAVWVAVRSVLSLVKAQKREPMPDPNTLLF